VHVPCKYIGMSINKMSHFIFPADRWENISKSITVNCRIGFVHESPKLDNKARLSFARKNRSDRYAANGTVLSVKTRKNRPERARLSQMIQEFSRPFGWNGKKRNIFKDFHPLRNLLTHGKRPRSNNRYTLLSRSFSAWHRSHVFARLASVICFSALAIGHMFSRAWHQLHVFPLLASSKSFIHRIAHVYK